MSNDKRQELRLERPDNTPPRPEREPLADRRDWEGVQQNETDHTDRLRIVGGWLYRTSSNMGTAMVFVPATGDE